MTKEQFFSKDVRNWVNETNKKYPNLSNKEFLLMFDEWFEKNENLIELNESIDLSEYCKLDEGMKVVKKEPGIEKVKDEIDDKTGDEIDDDDDEGEGFEVDDDLEIEPEPVTLVPSSEEKEIVSKIRGRYYVNNGKDYEHNIFVVVNAWYNRCISEDNKENEQTNPMICLLDTSNVENMAALFAFANIPNLDLSSWDVSNVKNMEGMFYKSTFDNPSIENWDVSSCINFKNMFTESRFSHDISGWNPGKVLVTVFDERGHAKIEPEIDPKTGVETGRHRVVKRWESAELPKIGARLVDINATKNERILKKLKELDELDKKTKTKTMKENKHVLTIDEFVNEGLYDTIKSGVKRGVKKIKEKINSFMIKLNNFYVATFTKDGEMKDETNVYTTLNYLAGGNVKGVSAFTKIDSPLLNKNVESTAYLDKKKGFYDFIDKKSQEYKNFLKWIDMMANPDLAFDDGYKLSAVEEARVPLSAKGSFLDNIPDITSEDFETMVKSIMEDNPSTTGRKSSRATFIFGAPGIGKTTIPQEIIKEYNKSNPNKKKSVIVIECGDLELGGLYLPMPDDTTMDKVIGEKSGLAKKLVELGFDSTDIENLEKVRILQTEESPKTWLPVYKPSTDIKVNRAKNLYANTYHVEDMVWNDAFEEFEPVDEATYEGGIIMFDEFLRADDELFKTIMQLITKRQTSGGYRIGSKWSIIACSNRPCDDDEVKKRFAKLAPAFGNRISGGAFNFVPDFAVWSKWARESGYFDEDTLQFISFDSPDNVEEVETIGKKGRLSKTRVYRRWHDLDPEKFHELGSENKMIFASPRSWSNLMSWVHDTLVKFDLDSILEIDPGLLKKQAIATIGLPIADEYCTYMDRIRKLGSSRPSTKSLFEGPVDIDTTVYHVTEAVKSVENYIMSKYKRSTVAKGTPEIGEMFLQMAKNLDKAYGELSSAHLIKLHTDIVTNILKIRSEEYPEDEPIRQNLADYINFVGETYDIDYADMN